MKIQSILLFAALLLTACSSDSPNEDRPDPQLSQPQPQSRLLTVEVSERGIQSEDANVHRLDTRAGDAITTSTLNAFSMNYQEDKYDFTKTADVWSTALWPAVGNNDKIDFYAYNSGSFNWNGGNPYISFVTEEHVGAMKDFLVAKHANISYNDDGGRVTQTFDHACAAVEFYVYKEEDADYTVNSIILRNVIKHGNCYYNAPAGEQWQDLNTTTYYTLTTGDFIVTKDKVRLPCGWLYLIPQSKTGIQIEVNYNGTKQKTFDLSGIWESGTRYPINIRIGRSAS